MKKLLLAIFLLAFGVTAEAATLKIATVTPEGSVQLPGIGSVPAQGLTLDELKMEIDERYALVVEGIEVIRRLWTEDNVTHEGHYWQLDDVTIRPQPLKKQGLPAGPLLTAKLVWPLRPTPMLAPMLSFST